MSTVYRDYNNQIHDGIRASESSIRYAKIIVQFYDK